MNRRRRRQQQQQQQQHGDRHVCIEKWTYIILKTRNSRMNANQHQYHNHHLLHHIITHLGRWIIIWFNQLTRRITSSCHASSEVNLDDAFTATIPCMWTDELMERKHLFECIAVSKVYAPHFV